jgi:hypothetical protein
MKFDLRAIGLKEVDWVHLTKERIQWRAHVNMVITLLVSIKGLEILEPFHNW